MVHIYFHGKVASALNLSYVPVLLSPNTTFLTLLYFIFQSYPELEEQFPPGILAIEVNKLRPTEHQIVHDEDRIDFNYHPSTYS